MASVIRLKRKSPTSTNSNITLHQGEPFYDLGNKALYIGNVEDEKVSGKQHITQITPTSNTNTNKVEFYLGENPSNKYSTVINNVNNAIQSDTADTLTNFKDESSNMTVKFSWGPGNKNIFEHTIKGQIEGESDSAKNVSETINNIALADIFESDNKTVKKSTYADNIPNKTLEGIQFDATTNIHHYFTCDTSANTSIKEAYSYTVSGSNESYSANFNKESGARIFIKFVNGDTSSNPKLNINNTGVSPISYNGQTLTQGQFEPNGIYEFVYAHSCYNLITPIGKANVNHSHVINDITDLDTATSSKKGLIQIGYEKPSSEVNNYQPVRLDENGKAFVHITGSIDGEAVIPWK